MNHPVKCWCFTLNNPEDYGATVASVRNLVEQEKKVHYAVLQYERGPAGTPHIQGYWVLASKKRLQQVRALIPGAHFEGARGSKAQNKTYCTKVETRIDGPWEFGEFVEERARSDLRAAVDSIRAGSSLQQLVQDHAVPFVRNNRGLVQLRTLLQPAKPRPDLEVYYIFGESGTGKSRYAYARWGDAYVKPPSGWWDGYDGEEAVIWDDFRANHMMFAELLQALDRYKYRGQIKGGYTAINCKVIVLTSIYTPEEACQFVHEPPEQFVRRITTTIEMKKRNGVVVAVITKKGQAPYEEVMPW